MKASVEATYHNDNDPMIRLMAFGVQEALNGTGKATDFDELAAKTSSIRRVSIYCYSVLTPVFVDINTTVPYVIDQVVWAQGLGMRNGSALFGELSSKGLLLIGHGISLWRLCSGKKTFNRFFVRKKFSRLTKVERKVYQELDTSYVLSRNRYLRGTHNDDAAIATQLCLFQILAENRRDLFTDRKLLSDKISLYFPPDVTLQFVFIYHSSPGIGEKIA